MNLSDCNKMTDDIVKEVFINGLQKWEGDFPI